MNQRFSSGRDKLHGFGRIYPVPIPLAPAVHAGATVVGLDPADNRLKLYFSDGSEWTRSIFDTTVSEQIERLINDIFLNGFNEEDLPDPTLLENLRRYAFNNTRGLPGFVWNNQWNYLTDEARVAEIATDIAADAVRVAEPDLLVTVGTGGDFETFREALESVSILVPPVIDQFFSGEIRILSGHVLTQQNTLINQNLNWVKITSEDAEVQVDCTGWTESTPIQSDRQEKYWLLAINSGLPAIETRLVQTGAIPSDGMCFLFTYNSYFALENNAVGAAINPETHNFEKGLIFGTIGIIADVYSTIFLDQFEITGQSIISLFASVANIRIVNSRLRGATSIRTQLQSEISLFNVDYRAIAGVDTFGSDIVLASGSKLVRDTCLGALPNMTASSGTVHSIGGGGSIYGPARFDGPVTGIGVVGAVAQSGGVSTGAIIQRGSNSNGEFVRFADGTQICSSPAINFHASDIASGNVFTSDSQTWTFPATFAETPVCSGQALNNARWLTFDAAGTTSVTYRQLSATFFTGASAQRLTAFGRWY